MHTLPFPQLLEPNPVRRLGTQGGAAEVKAHAFFATLDWEALGQGRLAPPFVPKLVRHGAQGVLRNHSKGTKEVTLRFHGQPGC
jgi:hypothetical protein